jgi:hypothetical protein
MNFGTSFHDHTACLGEVVGEAGSFIRHMLHEDLLTRNGEHVVTAQHLGQAAKRRIQTKHLI